MKIGGELVVVPTNMEVVIQDQTGDELRVLEVTLDTDRVVVKVEAL